MYKMCLFKIPYKCLFLLEYFILLLQNQTHEQTAVKPSNDHTKATHQISNSNQNQLDTGNNKNKRNKTKMSDM